MNRSNDFFYSYCEKNNIVVVLQDVKQYNEEFVIAIQENINYLKEITYSFGKLYEITKDTTYYFELQGLNVYNNKYECIKKAEAFYGIKEPFNISHFQKKT